MMTTHATTRIRRGAGHVRAAAAHGAFTLVEMLLAVSILALLMLSVGAAMKGSLASHDENDKVATATQLGRVILSRMMREVRTCATLDSTSTELNITPGPNDDGLTKIDYYVRDDALYCRRTVNGTPTEHVLIAPGSGESVQSFYILREDDPAGQPVSITAQLVMDINGHVLDVTASAVLRTSQFQ